MRVRHGYSVALRRWGCPAREAWGLAADQRLGPAFEARLTCTATETGSYERAARMATHWGRPAPKHLLRVCMLAKNRNAPLLWT